MEKTIEIHSGDWSLTELLVVLRLAASRSQVKRYCSKDAVTVNGIPLDWFDKVNIEDGRVYKIQVGSTAFNVLGLSSISVK